MELVEGQTLAETLKNSIGRGMQFDYKCGFISGIIKDDGMLHHLVNGTRDEALKTIESRLSKLKWIIRFADAAAIIG